MEQMTSICDMVGQIMQKKEEKGELRKIKRLKIEIGRFPFAMMMTRTIPLQSHPTDRTKVLKSSVQRLVKSPKEFKGISEVTCDVPVCEDPSTFDALSNHSEILSDSNDDDTSSDDDSYENIEYIEASPLNLEYDSLEEVNDEEQEEKEFDLEDIFQIQDVILREKLLNIRRLVTNIESLKDNPTPDHVLKSSSSFSIPITDSDSFFEESDTSFSSLDTSLP
ncbi:hypothetical protein Tco_0524148 [Tanacetum coccineum]